MLNIIGVLRVENINLPIQTHIFVACGLYERLRASFRPSATASGISPPPAADIPSTQPKTTTVLVH
jgi:hypothetical protein